MKAAVTSCCMLVLLSFSLAHTVRDTLSGEITLLQQLRHRWLGMATCYRLLFKRNSCLSCFTLLCMCRQSRLLACIYASLAAKDIHNIHNIMQAHMCTRLYQSVAYQHLHTYHCMWCMYFWSKSHDIAVITMISITCCSAAHAI